MLALRLKTGDIDQADSSLIDAMLNLRLKPDKSQLKDLVSRADSIDLTAYTPDSVKRFCSAFYQAELVPNNGQSTGDEVVGDTGAGSAKSASAKTAEAIPITAAVVLFVCTGVLIIFKKRK